jgi:hypothetical protein
MYTSAGKYYVAFSRPDDARAAATKWLTTGSFRINNTNSIKFTSCRLVYIPFCQVHCNYIGYWRAGIGKLDAGSLNMAMNQYKMALNHYESIPKDMRNFSNAPERPDEGHFVHYYNERGTLTGEWTSAVSVATGSEELDGDCRGWAIKLLSEVAFPENTVCYSTFGSWSEYAGGSRDNHLIPMADSDLFDRCMDAILKLLKKQFTKMLPKYHADPRVDLDQSESRYNTLNWTLLPVYILGYEVNNRSGVCLIEAVTANAVTGKKVRDIMGGFSRWFAPITALFTRKQLAAPLKQITHEDAPGVPAESEAKS